MKQLRICPINFSKNASPIFNHFPIIPSYYALLWIHQPRSLCLWKCHHTQSWVLLTFDQSINPIKLTTKINHHSGTVSFEAKTFLNNNARGKLRREMNQLLIEPHWESGWNTAAWDLDAGFGGRCILWKINDRGAAHSFMMTHSFCSPRHLFTSFKIQKAGGLETWPSS